MKKLAAFMAAVMVMTGVSTMSAGAISINCPVEGQWVSMSCTAEGTQWIMADGSVVTEDKNGNITQTAPTKPATTVSSNADNTNSPETASENSWILKGYTVDPSIKNGSYNHIIEQLIFDYTNEERVKAGLPKLVWSEGLTEYAEIRAKEISEQWGHLRPNNEKIYGGPENINVSGIEYCDLSGDKHISLQEVAQKTVKNWMESDGHRERIMSYEVDEYGDVFGTQSVAIGVYVSKQGSVYAVQVFDAGITTIGTTVFDDLEAGLTISPLLVGEDLERYNELIESN